MVLKKWCPVVEAVRGGKHKNETLSGVQLLKTPYNGKYLGLELDRIHIYKPISIIFFAGGTLL